MNPTTFPILTTKRLTLRQLSLNDQQDIFALRSDIENNKYLNREPCKTIEDAINFINKINESNAYYWAITLTDTQTLVGTICLFDFSSENNSCETGYELMTEFQGQGIMNEALQVIIDYVFQTLKLKKILAFTHSENQNSIKLLLKFNFMESLDTDHNEMKYSLWNKRDEILKK